MTDMTPAILRAEKDLNSSASALPHRRVNGIVRLVELVAAVGIFAIMIHVMANVIGRYVFDRPLPFTPEVVGYIELPIVALLGIVVAKHLGEHLQAPLIFDQLTWGNRRILVVVASFLVTLVCAGFAYYGFLEALHGARVRVRAGVSPVEYWPVLFLIPITFATLAVYYAIDALRAMRGRFDDKTEVEAAGEEYGVSSGDEPAMESVDLHAANTRDGLDPKIPDTRGLGAMSARAVRTGVRAARRHSRKPTWAVVALLGLGVVAVIAVFVAPNRELVGAAAVALMIVLLFFRVPIAFTLIIPSVLGMLSLHGSRAVANLMVDAPLGVTTQFLFTTLPMFILMGMLLATSGIAERVYDSCRLWLGWVPGGLAVATNVAGGGMAAISGSTLGTAYAVGRIGIPQMLRDGYDRRLAVGSVVAASLPGQIIPPSMSLIILSGITGAAVGPQLLAGIVPGVGMVIVMGALIVAIATLFPKMGGRTPDQRAARAAAMAANPVTWASRFRSLGGIWPLAVMFVFLFGAMYGGVLTATEAGAAGALAASAMVVFFRRKDQPLRHLLNGARQSVSTTGAIFLVIISAIMLTQLISVTGLGRLFSEFILDLGLDRVGFLLIVMLVYFLLGTFMEPLPIWLLTIPILQPVFGPLGIDLLWFGVFAVIMGEIAILSPPIGILTFLIHGLVQDPKINLGRKITLNDVYNATWMLMPGFLVLLILMILFPEFVTWLSYSGQSQ